MPEPDHGVDSWFTFDDNVETFGIAPLRVECVITHGPTNGQLNHGSAVTVTAIGAALAPDRAGGELRSPQVQLSGQHRMFDNGVLGVEFGTKHAGDHVQCLEVAEAVSLGFRIE